MDGWEVPLCAFCWPTWKVAQATDRKTHLPCCQPCHGKIEKVPGVPYFIWPHLRLAALFAFEAQTTEESR